MSIEPLSKRLRDEADEWEPSESIPTLLIEAADAIENLAAELVLALRSAESNWCYRR